MLSVFRKGYYKVKTISTFCICSSILFCLMVCMINVQTASSAQVGLPNKISYKLDTVWKKKVKDGKIIEEKAEPMSFLGEPYQYCLERLNSKEPILKKYVGKDLVEQKKLVVLNVTGQGNIYLADITSAGNVFLLSVFPKQKLVAISMQYWWSYEDVVILWQGFGKYHT